LRVRRDPLRRRRVGFAGGGRVKVKTVSYVGSFDDARSFPRRHVPEIAFVGRSNVGKSSLINSLVGRRNLARTSNTPGKTRTANWYVVNDAFCFVDMPGYGYAKVSQEERLKWRKLITRYIADREALRGVVHLLDIRHSPNDADREIVFSIQRAEKRLCLAFNKVDKARKGSLRATIANHLRVLDIASSVAVVAFSAETGEGRRELWTWLLESVGSE
jgi:GTP-binding protein